MKRKNSVAQIVPKKSAWRGWIAPLLLLCFAVQAFYHATQTSPTYDEPAHLTVSYLAHKTDAQDYDVSHPPLIRRGFAWALDFFADPLLPSTLPLPTRSSAVPLSEHPKSDLYLYSTAFVFANRVAARDIVLAGRGVSILLGCLLGWIVFIWSRRLYGLEGGWVSLAFFAFCPNLIAHSALATTDVGAVTFALLALYALALWIETPTLRHAIFCGVTLGLAVAAKYTNVILIPFSAIAFVAFHRSQRVREWLAALGAIWLTLCAAYGFAHVFGPHTLLPQDWEQLHWPMIVQQLYTWFPLPDDFLRGAAYGAYHNGRGHGAFFLGEFSSTGWWNYFPVAFLIKSPTALLAALLLGSGLALNRLLQPSNADEPATQARIHPDVCILLALLVIFSLCVMSAKLNIGLRHILLIYPIAYILLGSLGRLRARWKGALILLLCAEVGWAAPHYLAFFNRLVGGPQNGLHYLSDSNLDWGQDLPGLARYWEQQGRPDLVLSYFGTAVPQAYGLEFEALPMLWSFPRSTRINPVRSTRELCAISATNLQGTYFSEHDLYAWLRTKTPATNIGHSIYVYDITHDRDAQQHLLEIYEKTGETEKAKNRREKILLLQ